MKWSDRIKALSPLQRSLLRARLDRMHREKKAAGNGGTGQLRLVAYVACHDGASSNQDELKAFLRAKLPDYMVPSAFVFANSFPLNANGKIDRRALSEKYRFHVGGSSQPETPRLPARPESPSEEELVKIWCDVLGVARVGINDNFFNLGGHSLLALRVLARIRKTFQVDLPLKVLFEAPTIARLAVAITLARQNEPGAPIRKVPRLSTGQFNARMEASSDNTPAPLITRHPGEAAVQK